MLAAFLQAADADGPQLHNTTSPAHVRGGQAHDVIPAEVSVDLDDLRSIRP
jgi:hypothetical protein